MISGMRARRRSAFKTGGGYKFYRLYITQTNAWERVRIAELGLFGAGDANGVPSGGIASASGYGTRPQYYPPAAFDGDPSTRWDNEGVNGLPAWLRYDFPHKVTVTGYRIQYTTAQPTWSPRAWEFQASNDGTTWTTLDAQSNVTWSTGQVRDYPL